MSEDVTSEGPVLLHQDQDTDGKAAEHFHELSSELVILDNIRMAQKGGVYEIDKEPELLGNHNDLNTVSLLLVCHPSEVDDPNLDEDDEVRDDSNEGIHLEREEELNDHAYKSEGGHGSIPFIYFILLV